MRFTILEVVDAGNPFANVWLGRSLPLEPLERLPTAICAFGGGVTLGSQDDFYVSKEVVIATLRAEGLSEAVAYWEKHSGLNEYGYVVFSGYCCEVVNG